MASSPLLLWQLLDQLVYFQPLLFILLSFPLPLVTLVAFSLLILTLVSHAWPNPDTVIFLW